MRFLGPAAVLLIVLVFVLAVVGLVVVVWLVVAVDLLLEDGEEFGILGV